MGTTPPMGEGTRVYEKAGGEARQEREACILLQSRSETILTTHEFPLMNHMGRDAGASFHLLD